MAQQTPRQRVPAPATWVQGGVGMASVKWRINNLRSMLELPEEAEAEAGQQAPAMVGGGRRAERKLGSRELQLHAQRNALAGRTRGKGRGRRSFLQRSAEAESLPTDNYDSV